VNVPDAAGLFEYHRRLPANVWRTRAAGRWGNRADLANESPFNRQHLVLTPGPNSTSLTPLKSPLESGDDLIQLMLWRSCQNALQFPVDPFLPKLAHVSFLGPQAVMPRANGFPYAVEHFRRPGRRHACRVSRCAAEVTMSGTSG